MNRFDLYLALIEAAEGIMKLIHLAVKITNANTPIMLLRWSVIGVFALKGFWS